MAKLTPMMEQWQQAKSAQKDAILLFRMGDFYELFGNDALIAAPILDLTLTSRDKDKSGLKMAGFPHHAADAYIAKLVERGHKVAICDQLEDPKLKKGVVKRGITNVVTPGTAIDHDALFDFSFLVALVSDGEGWAVAALDYKTATFKTTSSTSREKIIEEILRYAPKELINLSSDLRIDSMVAQLKSPQHGLALRVERRERPHKLIPFAKNISLTEGENLSASLIVAYIAELKGSFPAHFTQPQRYSIENQLLMDESTRANLDLLPKKKGDVHNLFSILDEMKTAMGRRALLQAVQGPMTTLSDIEARHDLVAELIKKPEIREQILSLLSGFVDLERLVALLASRKLSPRGMAQLRDCILRIEAIREVLRGDELPHTGGLLAGFTQLDAIKNPLTLLSEEPPLAIRDGGVFRAGVDKNLDELRDVLSNSQRMLLDLENQEREKTSIPSLKIRFTRVFGYYIEITKTHLEKVPDHYRRKQTVANGERFTTKDLGDLEYRITNAESMALDIEEAKFRELEDALLPHSLELIAMARKIALIDLVAHFAELALLRSWVRPTMKAMGDGELSIKSGRHPVVEKICQRDGQFFVPNDVKLDATTSSIMLITGPNMAGKSTIMRQVALMQIMAQIGSFVPAASAELSVCDAIFARVGAADDVATKRSTFMVEMTETAAILSNATANSLIVLDEIGRGTSTYDGLSLAQAIAEYVHDNGKGRVLFATHYHELTRLEQRLTRLHNFHVEVAEHARDIKFLYSLARGPALKSFGIEVARMSGLPASVLARAKEILDGLEMVSSQSTPSALKQPIKQAPQPDLFGSGETTSQDRGMIDALVGLDINRLTPLQALNKLASWQASLRKRG